MRRIDLFEFLDQPWLPYRLRSAATRYLVAAYRFTPFPALWADGIARVLEECGLEQITDLCSGSGGPVTMVLQRLKPSEKPPKVTLTDLYPTQFSQGDGVSGIPSISYWPQPVDAAGVPPELEGLRTVFASFHHFATEAARAVLRDAFEQRRAICIFEATSRTPAAIATSLLIPFLVLMLTPFVRPLSVFQILFTYFVPVLPLLVFWDGLVSHLRTYSLAELEDLVSGLESTDYRWEFGLMEIPHVPVKPAYLIGRPTTRLPETCPR